MKTTLAFLLSFLLLLPSAFAVETDTHISASSSYSKELLNLINHYRAENRLKPLVFDRKLAALAESHSRNMQRHGTLSHENFGERFKKSGRRSCVENVGWNYRTPKEQLSAWKESGAHNSNILSPDIKRAGISKTGPYVTFLACD